MQRLQYSSNRCIFILIKIKIIALYGNFVSHIGNTFLERNTYETEILMFSFRTNLLLL